MKKFKIFLLLGLAFILGIDKINAECDNKTQLEINTASSNVTMNYNINTVVLDRNGKEHPEISPSDVETGELSEYLKSDKITIKGGVVMFHLTQNIRRATIDIDMDLIKLIKIILKNYLIKIITEKD